MNTRIRARFSLILSMVIFGTIGLFVRYIPVSSAKIALYRALLATLVIEGYLLIRKEKIYLKDIKKQLPFLLISGMAMGFNWVFLFEAYKYTSVSAATLAYYFAPVIVMAVSPVLFKERISKRGIMCFVGASIGIVLITGVSGSGGTNNLLGIFYGLCAAVLYATVILINKFIKNVGGIHRTFLQFVAAIIVLFPYVTVTEGLDLECQVLGLICLIVVGVVHTGITYCMYFSSLKELPGQEAAILSYIDPLVAVIISITVLKEGFNLIQLIGALLILGFTLYNEIGSDK